MKISDKGLGLIKRFEGCELKPYICAGGKLTIGYGSTGPHVRPGVRITQQEAEELLRKDVARFDADVSKLAPVATQGQHDALVSFAFNLGTDALRKSTLMRLHKAGDYTGAAEQFGRWVNAGGKRLNGLVKRRAAEAELYRS